MNTSEIIITVILAIVIVIFLVLKKKKEKASSWIGEVIKKRVISDDDDENHVYRLVFKTQAGKKVTVAVKEEMFNQANVGDKYEKISGNLTPKKIS